MRQPALRWSLAFIACLLPLLTSGCSGPLSPAMHEFRRARYPEAVREFRRIEPELSGWSTERRARYALYRGLTQLSLGEAPAANYWLGYAKALDERDPSLLSPADQGRLRSAWRSLGHMDGEDSVRLVARRR